MVAADEDDDIDTEVLQSRIDMSMSLVHNMVSSWVKPSQKAGTTSSYNAQKELEEHIRRPPRLGVGAPIPEASSASRDTTRLKTQLTTGKKRARDEDGGVKAPPLSSDDEEESRTAVMQKKIKIVSFSGGKKRRNQVHGLFTPQPTPASSQTQISQDIEKADDKMEIDLVDKAPVPPVTSPRKKKKKHKKASNLESRTVELSSPPLTPGRDRAPLNRSIADDNALHTTSAVPEPRRTPVRDGLLSNKQTSKTPNAASSPARIRASQDISATFKLPLLNLDGPPPDISDPEDINDPSQSGSPKKKRRRRKKKKRLPNASADV